ncbi:MAG: M12 family metallo-peptidase [Granulosicoccus sp.]
MTVVLKQGFRLPFLYPLLLVALMLAFPINAKTASHNFALVTTPVQVTIKENNTLELASDDQVWIIKLERISLLNDSDSVQSALLDIPFFFRGSVLNNTSSWIRLSSDTELFGIENHSLDSAAISGHIFVNGALYNLSYSPLTGYGLTPLDSSHQPRLNLSPRSAIFQSAIPVGGQAISGPALDKAIKIGIVVDSKYDEHYNGGGLATALRIIHNLDGLFQNQLGLAVTIESRRYYKNADSDPLRDFSGDLEEMLNEFRLNRLSDNELDPELALVHLFTGNSDPSQPIGLSWIGTVCQTDGYDISVSTPSPYSMLLSAHEIAHNLGAVHDDERRCIVDSTVTGNEVMWPELSDNITSTFSNCSIESMRAALSSPCVAENIELSIGITSTPSDNLFEQDVIISATNWDTARAARNVTSVTEFPSSVQLSSLSAGCRVSGTTLSCDHGNIGLYSTSNATVTVQYANTDPARIDSELKHSQFMDTNDANNKATVQVDFNAPTSSANVLAANDDESQIASSGGSAGIGSSGPLGLLSLLLFLVPITVTRRSMA